MGRLSASTAGRKENASHQCSQGSRKCQALPFATAPQPPSHIGSTSKPPAQPVLASPPNRQAPCPPSACLYRSRLRLRERRPRLRLRLRARRSRLRLRLRSRRPRLRLQACRGGRDLRSRLKASRIASRQLAARPLLPASPSVQAPAFQPGNPLVQAAFLPSKYKQVRHSASPARAAAGGACRGPAHRCGSIQSVSILLTAGNGVTCQMDADRQAAKSPSGRFQLARCAPTCPTCCGRGCGCGCRRPALESARASASGPAEGVG